jgi:hypothetical protein
MSVLSWCRPATVAALLAFATPAVAQTNAEQLNQAELSRLSVQAQAPAYPYPYPYPPPYSYYPYPYYPYTS